MGNPSLLWLCIFATVSVSSLISLHLLLQKVNQFHNHSSTLQQIMHTFMCFSLSYSFLFNPSLTLDGRDTSLDPPVWCYFYVCIILSLFPTSKTDYNTQAIRFNILYLLYLISIAKAFLTWEKSKKNRSSNLQTISSQFFNWLAWVIFTALTTIKMEVDNNNPYLPYFLGPVSAYLLFCYQSLSISRVSIRIPVSIKIIVGIIGNIVANHYLEDKDIHLFWLLVSLAFFWMGNIAMMQSTCQAGIFGFLVGAILDVAGDIFGLKIYMWLVGVACAVLLIFFENMDRFNLWCIGVGGHVTEANEQDLAKSIEAQWGNHHLGGVPGQDKEQ